MKKRKKTPASADAVSWAEELRRRVPSLEKELGVKYTPELLAEYRVKAEAEQAQRRQSA